MRHHKRKRYPGRRATYARCIICNNKSRIKKWKKNENICPCCGLGIFGAAVLSTHSESSIGQAPISSALRRAIDFFDI